MCKKKIIIWEAAGNISGGQRVALNILDALRSDYECIFFVPVRGDLTKEIETRGSEYKIVPLGEYRKGTKGFFDALRLAVYFFPVLFKTIKMVKSYKADLIYSNNAMTFIWSALIGRFLPVPVIWHIHNIFLSRTSVRIINTVAKLGRVSLILTLCKASKDQFPALSDRIRIIHNAIDIEKARQRSQASCSVRDELNISSDKKIISTIGWIGELKNQLTFIQAIPYIIKERNNTCFIIVGGAPKEQGEYYEKLRETVKALELQAKVFFLGHRKNIFPILKDIYINTVNSSGFEAQPLVILEAAVFGVSTVGAACGGTGEFIENSALEGKAIGMVYKPGDEKDLARKILLLLEDEALYLDISNNCREYSKRFEVHSFNQSIKKIVKEVLHQEDRQ